MGDFPGPAYPPPFVHTGNVEYSGYREACISGTGTPVFASMSWGTANQARYVPMSLPWAYPVRRVFWVNGSTVGTNMDFGIYTPGGLKIYSTGSTVQSGASVPQFVSPASSFVLPPGDYFFAQNCDGTTNAAWGGTTNWGATENQQWGGVMQQAVGAVALPTSATFASATVAGFGLCGVTWTTDTF